MNFMTDCPNGLCGRGAAAVAAGPRANGGGGHGATQRATFALG